MNFIFGIILLAMFILALRVIWATAWQLLSALKQCGSSVLRTIVPSAKRDTGYRSSCPNPS
jgi:hypothetical protein